MSSHRFAGRRERASNALTYDMLQEMPVNLRKQAIREARNRNETIVGKRRHRKHRKAKQAPDFDHSEHMAMLKATEGELKHILADCELLSDIPFDVTPIELLGKIAIAEGNGTTIYVKRDGLSTLTVVLHQHEPTIANLKHAIADIASAQQKRTWRDRSEERLTLRRVATEVSKHEDQQLEQQVDSTSSKHFSNELVCSVVLHGHKHRAQVSWRFLWRVFMLFNVDTNQPIHDENGRVPLRALGIKNAATLKFTHRVKYCGRKRQN